MYTRLISAIFKIIAIVMALTMMMAITVPVFAAEITNESADKTSTVDVKTTFDENADWSYTVTIPAGVEIAWNDKTEKDEIIIEKNDDLKEIKEEFDNSDLFND